jgi:hypothetical protein
VILLINPSCLPVIAIIYFLETSLSAKYLRVSCKLLEMEGKGYFFENLLKSSFNSPSVPSNPGTLETKYPCQRASSIIKSDVIFTGACSDPSSSDFPYAASVTINLFGYLKLCQHLKSYIGIIKDILLQELDLLLAIVRSPLCFFALYEACASSTITTASSSESRKALQS